MSVPVKTTQKPPQVFVEVADQRVPPVPVTINVRPEVAAFARAMEHKLAANDHKKHWREMRVHQLLEMLRDEVDELVRAVADFHGGMGHHRNVLDEAADVANFAMMVADVVALKPCEIGRMEATERE